MKYYDVIWRKWNANHTDIEMVDSSGCATYAEAQKMMRAYCKRYDRVDIELYELRKSDCDDEEDFESEWIYNRSDYQMWTESWEKGKRVPIVWIGGTQPIWRWDRYGNEAFSKKQVMALNKTLE